MKQSLAGVVRRWSGVASTTSTMVALSGMVQRSLGDGCVLMDGHRAVPLFGSMAVSTADWLGKDIADLFPEVGSAV